MSTVRDLLEAKKISQYYSIDSNETVFQALEIMAEAQIGSILVIEGGKFVGIYTERDYLRKGELKGRTAKGTKIKDVMTPRAVTVSMDTSVAECSRLMDQHHVRHLPVTERGQLVGVVSIRDVLVALLKDRESEIHGLENYIVGTEFQS